MVAAVAGLLCLSGGPSLWAQLPSTQFSRIFPLGAKFGTTIDVTVAGGDHIELSQLVFSHPGIKATPKMHKPSEFFDEEPLPGQFSVAVAGDVPPGVYEARVVGRYGVSNPRAFTVGLYEEQTEGGGNNAAASAVEISIDKTVSGWVDANAVDHFKLALKEGQRVLLDCAAQRIDSRLDATMVVYDPNGKEIVRSRDYVGTDPFIALTAPLEGEYIITLHDAVYRGGNDSFFRLTAHMGPHIDFLLPPAGLAGSHEQYTIYGRNLPGGQITDLLVDGQPLESLPVNIPLPGDETLARQLMVNGRVAPNGAALDSYLYRLNTAVPVPIHFAHAPVVKEQEPNNAPSEAQQVAVPCEIAGQFYPARDNDYVQFHAKKGEVYYIDLVSHRLGVDVDPYLIVQRVTKNDKGEETVANIVTTDDPGDRNGRIGSNFDTSTDDPTYRLTADQDAVYRVIVRDQNSGYVNDPRNVYRLVIRQPQPDFRVIAIAEKIQSPINAAAVQAGTTSLRRGGTTMYTVRLERRDGFAGEVEISAEGLPEGVVCPKTVVAGNVSSTVLIFKAADNAPFWSGAIRIVGKAKIGDQDVTRLARGGAVVWETGNRVQQPPNFRTTQDLFFAVIDKDPDKALVELGEDKIWETSKGGALEIPIKVTRREDFKGDLALVPFNFPAEFKPGNIAVKGDAAEAKLALSITNAKAKPGIYTVYLRADTKIKHVLNPGAIAKAEAEQKKLDEIIKSVTAQLTEANKAKDAAVKAATDAAAAAKTATEAKTAADTAATQAADAAKQAADKLAAAKEAAAKDEANEDLKKAVTEAETAKAEADKKNTEAAEKQKAAVKAATEAQEKSKTAEAAKVAAEKLAADTDAKLKRAQAAKPAADKKVTDTKNGNKPADRTVAYISTPVRLRIVETPLKLTAKAPENAVKQGEASEVPVTLERLYGFADQAEVTFELPKGVKGIAVEKVTLAKDQKDGKFAVTVAKDATPGDHTVTIRAKAKFNKLDVQTTQQIVLKIEKVEAAE
jgi:hypothetical protein